MAVTFAFNEKQYFSAHKRSKEQTILMVRFKIFIHAKRGPCSCVCNAIVSAQAEILPNQTYNHQWEVGSSQKVGPPGGGQEPYLTEPILTSVRGVEGNPPKSWTPPQKIKDLEIYNPPPQKK